MLQCMSMLEFVNLCAQYMHRSAAGTTDLLQELFSPQSSAGGDRVALGDAPPPQRAEGRHQDNARGGAATGNNAHGGSGVRKRPLSLLEKLLSNDIRCIWMGPMRFGGAINI